MTSQPASQTGPKHYKYERTFTAIKPDGIQRSLMGEIISRFERVGLKLVGMKMLVPSLEHVEKHYTLDPNWITAVGEKALKARAAGGEDVTGIQPIDVGKRVLQGLQIYLSSGPVIAMIWEGAHAVKLVRKLVGSTEPLSSDVGTIRGDYMLDSYAMSDGDGRAIRNLVHASGSVEEAENEINLWFSKDEIYAYKLAQDAILYDVNLDGVQE